MSRGLGKRQVDILRAMKRLEDGDARRTGAWWYVSEIYTQVWEGGLREQEESRWAAYAAEKRAYRADVEKLDGVGDADAIEWCKRQSIADALGSAIRRRPQNRVNSRPEGSYDASNPSRTLALLARRGLIERDIWGGGSSWARLTDAGRVVASSSGERG